MFKNTYLGNSDNGLFVVFSRMNGDTEELDVSIADLICYAGKRPIILWKDDSAYSLTKVETSYDAQADETTVVAVFGNNGYKVVVSGVVNSGSKGTLVYDAASSGGGSTGGGVLLVHQDENNVLDKTYKEITNAPFAILHKQNGNITSVKPVEMFGYNNGVYAIQFNNLYTTDSEDGYPVQHGVN